jgi:ABC-2 type transport system ATP-binding protein
VGEHDRVIIEAAGGLEPAAEAMSSLPGVLAASAADGALALIVDNARTLLPELLRAAADGGASVRGVDVDEPDLEAVFLHLTGRALRD